MNQRPGSHLPRAWGTPQPRRTSKPFKAALVSPESISGSSDHQWKHFEGGAQGKHRWGQLPGATYQSCLTRAANVSKDIQVGRERRAGRGHHKPGGCPGAGVSKTPPENLAGKALGIVLLLFVYLSLVIYLVLSKGHRGWQFQYCKICRDALKEMYKFHRFPQPKKRISFIKSIYSEHTLDRFGDRLVSDPKGLVLLKDSLCFLWVVKRNRNQSRVPRYGLWMEERVVCVITKRFITLQLRSRKPGKKR